jgi:tRNA A-37 threonylcarbamoyl transferase component Bud32/tetratricopeptide (TPR) repeat protein/TolB-like protein
LHAGTRLGPYEITASLGAGAMGEVYRARDARLGRDVAIKVVAAHSIDAPQARERFEREARSVARLQHPNICTVHDVGDVDGHAFIVMELLQGETLQQRLRRGPMDLQALVDTGTAIADGLQAAHAAGIVHRDVKPANIFLSEHGPKILDFGLAKADLRATRQASDVDTQALLTEAGAAVGTIAYMSPEQLRGEPVDARSDLFSLGVVLYEMATGRRPFEGSTSAAIGGAILHQDPVPPRSLRADLPGALDQLLLRALEKDRDLRYQSAADLRADLQRQGRSTDVRMSGPQAAPVPAAPIRATRSRWLVAAAALAVVAAAAWFYATRGNPALTETDTVVLGDFVNTTGDAVFDDALRQGLLVQLQQSPYLHVLPDQNVGRVLAMMGQSLDAPLTSAVALEVCQRSGSAAVINGSIARLGSQYVLGITAVDCRSGDHLDTQQAQVSGKENVLSALSEMSSAFRARAGESLAMIRTHETPLEEATTPSLEALKAFSSAMRGASGCGSMIPLLERAVELDDEFALAHANLAICYSAAGERQLAVRSATRAYELRHRATDRERFFIEYAYERDVTGDLEDAFRSVTVWTQTYPRDLAAHGLRGGFAAHGTGRYEAVLESSERALAIDPDFVFAHGEAVSANMFLDRFEAARRAIDRADHLDPASLVLGYYIAMLENDQAAEDRLVARIRESPEPHLLQHAQSLAAARAGQLRRARALAQEAADTATGLDQRETAAAYESAVAVWEALSGNESAARQRALSALGGSDGRDVTYAGALALALSGDVARSESLADDLERRYSGDTLVRFTYVPTLRALAALSRHDPAAAIDLLQVNVPYERAVPATAFNFFFGSLCPVYVRGQAYAASGQARQAAAEFQKIIDHPGLMMGDPAGARARLEKARSLAQDGDRVAARTAYHEFLELWKDADPDVPILVQARSEAATLERAPGEVADPGAASRR